MNRTAWAAAALAVVLAAGCTSSDKPSPGPVGASSASAPSSTTAPSSTSPAPSPSQAKPLSPFEKDPAVQALRAWAAQAAQTVNAGKFDAPALDALMTSAMAKSMKTVLGSDVGLLYPGPIPFTPRSVTVVGSTQRTMHVCVVGSGFAQNRSTHRPAGARTVLPIDAAASRVSGRWLVSKQQTATDFSCAGVRVAMPTWDD